MNDIPPSAMPGVPPAALPPKPAAGAAAPAPAAVQQPGRHRRDAGGPRRGDLGSRESGRPSLRRGVRTDRRDGGAGCRPQARVPDKSSRRTISNSPKPPPPPAARRGSAAYEPPPFPKARSRPPQILSHSTVSAVESAFNTLAHTVLSNNARTLEDLVKEMLRPMLKSWLDDNLPGLVERIVKAEIERVSRGRC